MATTVLVTGGTGTLGRHVVPKLRDAGCDVRVLSRNASGPEVLQGDLTTGEGVDAALAGVEVVVHCAGTQSGDDVKAATLVKAATAAGVRHLVFISVVGADRVPVVSRTDRALFGYFASKLAAERVIESSGLPWTTLRATQFYDLVDKTVAALTKLPVVPAPGVRLQPVEAEEVATRLVELALAPPAGLVPDLAGPTVYPLRDLVRSYLRATGKHRLLLPVHLPGRAAKAVADGALLAQDGIVGRRTWEQFLDAGPVAARPEGQPSPR